MASLNNVVLLGNLTRDPEVRYTPSGTPVATLGLAVNNRMKQGDEWKDDPCFIDVVVFGKQAESCGEYLSKGQPVLVEGRLRYRTWEGQDGQKRSKHEVSRLSRPIYAQRRPRTREWGILGRYERRGVDGR